MMNVAKKKEVRLPSKVARMPADPHHTAQAHWSVQSADGRIRPHDATAALAPRLFRHQSWCPGGISFK